MSPGAPARRYARALAFLLPALTACGRADPDARPEAVADTLLAEALVPLHLADARAATTGEDADSLRAAAYAEARRTTGLDSVAVASRLRAAAARPEEAAALYRRVSDRLEALRR
jgi:hypothetical protein